MFDSAESGVVFPSPVHSSTGTNNMHTADGEHDILLRYNVLAGFGKSILLNDNSGMFDHAVVIWILLHVP